ncbi:MAG: tetratricopeptide repeat protein [Legionella sp.]|nr:tetratricopeptide repeat protein [Legionella sp.]
MQPNYQLLIILTVIFSLTVVGCLYPLRQSKRLCSVLFLAMIVFLPLGYKFSGGWHEWRIFLQKEVDKQKAQRFLTAVNGQKGVIATLKQKLQKDPKSAQGWYLLGRLYASQGEWPLAADAFRQAYNLKPEDALITINYAQSLWQKEGDRAHARIEPLLEKVLINHPTHPDAMALLAQCAFEKGDYSTAITYWERLLSIVQNGTEDADLLRRAIAQAHQKMDEKK